MSVTDNKDLERDVAIAANRTLIAALLNRLDRLDTDNAGLRERVGWLEMMAEVGVDMMVNRLTEISARLDGLAWVPRRAPQSGL